MPKKLKQKPYHHGDLRADLLREANSLIQQQGIEQLSLRKLAQRCDVSRSAPYHHFKDKHGLLCAIACEGFLELEKLVTASPHALTSKSQLTTFVLAYLHFACDRPERYDLMFGRQIWKLSQPTDELRKVAHRTFRLFAGSLTQLFSADAASRRQHLRLAQASWATLHGLCRLLIDGIYLDRSDMEEVAEEAITLILPRLKLAQ